MLANPYNRQNVRLRDRFGAFPAPSVAPPTARLRKFLQSNTREHLRMLSAFPGGSSRGVILTPRISEYQNGHTQQHQPTLTTPACRYKNLCLYTPKQAYIILGRP